jgi:hypothetical protein
MFRGVLRRLAARFGSDGTEDAEDAEDGGTGSARFVPSVLDASVRHAHGGSGAAVEREMSEIDEEARRLEEQRRKG